jgi:hypothetical protein
MFESKNQEKVQSTNKLEIFEHLKNYIDNEQISKDILRSNLGLFLTNANLTKILFINELFTEAAKVPGSIYEFGCHLGQNLILFENLRSIYEPFNNQRRIVGFDMFGLSDGYPGRGDLDSETPELTSNSYSLPDDYPEMLSNLFSYHQSLSVLNGESRLSLLKGEASSKLAEHLESNPGEIVALAYLDLATYAPTKNILNAIEERLVPGSILVADEINFKNYQGASRAFLEFLKGKNYEIIKSEYMTDRGYVVMK